MTDKALSGVKVLDLTHYIAGPYCTKLLADYGAEVIKIEKPGLGDGCRRMGPFLGNEPHPEKSGLFLYLNTNKHGITLNLKSEAGLGMFKDLAREADILVENFSPGVMDRMGLSQETLEKINPKLVMTSISNFGQTGPYRDFKSSEITTSAMGGWMNVVGDAEREPLKPGGSQTQFVGGLLSAVGTMTMFYYCREKGIGQHMDISLMEAVLFIQQHTTSMYSYHEQITTRQGNFVWPPPGFILPCRDGYIGAIAVTNSQWQSLCDWMGKPELKEDPDFVTAVDRTENLDMLLTHLITWLADHDQEELFREAQKRKIPFGIPASAEMLLNSKHLNERGYFVEVDHPVAGKLKYPGAQVKIGDLDYELKPAPLLGEHNQDIYCGRLGFSQNDLINLREQEVI